MSEEEVALEGGKLPLEEGVMNWARGPREFTDWVRKNSEKLGIDTGKYILGYAIGTITGDDIGCFASLQRRSTQASKGDINLDRRSILERLDWESDLTELSDDLRERVKGFREEIASSLWSDIQAEKGFYDRWIGGVRNFAIARRDDSKDQKIGNAVDYTSGRQRQNKIDKIYSKTVLGKG